MVPSEGHVLGLCFTSSCITVLFAPIVIMACLRSKMYKRTLTGKCMLTIMICDCLWLYTFGGIPALFVFFKIPYPLYLAKFFGVAQDIFYDTSYTLNMFLLFERCIMLKSRLLKQWKELSFMFMLVPSIILSVSFSIILTVSGRWQYFHIQDMMYSNDYDSEMARTVNQIIYYLRTFSLLLSTGMLLLSIYYAHKIKRTFNSKLTRELRLEVRLLLQGGVAVFLSTLVFILTFFVYNKSFQIFQSVVYILLSTSTPFIIVCFNREVNKTIIGWYYGYLWPKTSPVLSISPSPSSRVLHNVNVTTTNYALSKF